MYIDIETIQLYNQTLKKILLLFLKNCLLKFQHQYLLFKGWKVVEVEELQNS